MVQILENVGGLGTGFLIPSPPPPQPPRAQSRTSSSGAAASSTSSRTIAIAAGSAGGAAVCAAAALCMALAIMRSRKSAAIIETVLDEGDDDDKKHFVITTETPEALPRDGLYIFTRSELKQATNSYEEKLLLGEGGAGKVYLGTLPSGQCVAIKRLYREKKLGEFYKEIEILAKLRHKNLTTLLGYCLSDHEHALVYEYMPGGNLAAALHHGDLSWRHRVKIAANVAEGLVYLHGFSEGPVVHRDVKPTNVLLGEGWAVAKLSDFGVSRVVDVDSGATHLTTEVRGTMGYVDPESFAVGHVSEATDVYSFGVVLLQLVTGMKAVVQTPSGGAESIVNAACGAAEAAAAVTMVDPRLGEGWDRASVEEVFRTGVRCVRQSKNFRPRMAEVLAVLSRVIADLDALEEPSAAAEDEGANTTTNGEMFSSDPTTSSASDVLPPSILERSL